MSFLHVHFYRAACRSELPESRVIAKKRHVYVLADDRVGS